MKCEKRIDSMNTPFSPLYKIISGLLLIAILASIAAVTECIATVTAIVGISALTIATEGAASPLYGLIPLI